MSDARHPGRGLGKRYRIGRRERYRTLRDVWPRPRRRAFQWMARSPSSARRTAAADAETFWALRDVVVRRRTGRGASASSAATAPARARCSRSCRASPSRPPGAADIHGRVGSLLEVGTGFHPELTGRENIYLNGAILGMRRAEIARKFDEIVAFAEVEQFIDTPVKHYSSGMYMRLAFAVAAHLEPEILIVDEVLAVGDAAFQRKCLGKMGDVAHAGRTVLFVSHNLEAIQRLCTPGACCWSRAGWSGRRHRRRKWWAGISPSISAMARPQPVDRPARA